MLCTIFIHSLIRIRKLTRSLRSLIRFEIQGFVRMLRVSFAVQAHFTNDQVLFFFSFTPLHWTSKIPRSPRPSLKGKIPNSLSFLFQPHKEKNARIPLCFFYSSLASFLITGDQSLVFLFKKLRTQRLTLLSLAPPLPSPSQYAITTTVISTKNARSQANEPNQRANKSSIPKICHNLTISVRLSI